VVSAAVVTGAARGFGLEIARRLIGRGHAVVLTDVDATAVEAAAYRLGPTARGMTADARDPQAHRDAAAFAGELGRLEVWVNNAGVAPPGKGWEGGDELVRRAVEVNLLGAMYGSRAAVETMRAHGGRILNIASMSAFGPVPGLGIYGATKAGVLSFTTSLQGELEIAGLPIRAHVLCPDAADTRMVRDIVDEEDSALLFSGGALLDPGEVADRAVAMLDGRRVVRAVPGWRSAMARTSGLNPTAGLKVLRALRWVGDRRRPAPGVPPAA
jgi:NAD(P)-dependent dehydrogenase (short-subunit alcohol dehydrogenase family)